MPGGHRWPGTHSVTTQKWLSAIATQFDAIALPMTLRCLVSDGEATPGRGGSFDCCPWTLRSPSLEQFALNI